MTDDPMTAGPLAVEHDRHRDEHHLPMRIAIAAMAVALALSVVVGLAAPQPVDAARRGAWHTWSSDAKLLTKTFTDRTPGNTAVRLDLEKKPGSKCWARVTVGRRGFREAQFRPVYKHARHYAVRNSMVADWLGGGGGTARVTVKVQTNGRCEYRLWTR